MSCKFKCHSDYVTYQLPPFLLNPNYRVMRTLNSLLTLLKSSLTALLSFLSSSSNSAILIHPSRVSWRPITEKTKDGHHFLKVLDGEVKRLLGLAEVANRDLEEQEDLPEEAKGKLRSAAGKAQLLASQKMQQFKGLCTKNINQVICKALHLASKSDMRSFVCF